MSLRARVLVGMAVIAVVLGSAAVVLTRAVEAHLVAQVDEQLEEVVDEMIDDPRSALDTHPPQVDDLAELFGPEAPQQPAPPQLRMYLGVVTSGSVRPFVEHRIDGETISPVIDADHAVAAARSREIFTVGSEGADLRYRVRAVPARLPDGEQAVAVVGLPLDDVDSAMGRLVRVEIFATLAVLAVLGLVTWWVIRLGIRPIKEMTASASTIAAGDLSHRVPEAPPDTEAGQLGAALNRMLGRIEQAFRQQERSEERLRQFVADASHELRTPVTTVRGYAELYQSGGLAESEELDEAMRRTGQEAVRMGTLIDDMLLLARLDRGRPLETEPVDLALLVEDAARDARAIDPDRPVEVRRADAPLMVSGDSDRLRQVLANVVTNALVHTPSGSAVELRTSRREGRAVVEVADNGPGMPAEAAQRAFERFYRADQSRSRRRGGSGLGLAIVQAIVAAHGGEASLTSTPGVGTTVRVELPLLAEEAPT